MNLEVEMKSNHKGVVMQELVKYLYENYSISEVEVIYDDEGYSQIVIMFFIDLVTQDGGEQYHSSPYIKLAWDADIVSDYSELKAEIIADLDRLKLMRGELRL